MTKTCPRIILTALFCLALAGAPTFAAGESQSARSESVKAKESATFQTGTASWYGGSFIGGKTASGERYRAFDRTAAHRKLPFGTFVRVTNLRNDRTSIVRINNRGPFTKGRIIDVSKQAAVDLKMIGAGTARVRLEVVSREAALSERTATPSGVL